MNWMRKMKIRISLIYCFDWNEDTIKKIKMKVSLMMNG